MKKFVIALGVVAILAIAFMLNVLRASREPVTAAPDPLAAGRQKLHDQLAASEQREAEIEEQDWDSIPLLRELIAAHEQRIAKLQGNSQAGEIVSHDRDAIAKLQKRIDELTEQESHKPPAPAAAPSTKP